MSAEAVNKFNADLADMTNPSIIYDLPDADYRKADGVSNSMLKVYRERMSMEYAKARLATPMEPTEALAFGKAFHHELLTPDEPKPYVILPADAPKRPTKKQREAKKPSPETVAAVAWWNDFETANEGKDVLDATGTYGGVRLVKTMERFMRHPLVNDILAQDCKREVSCFAPYNLGGSIMRKCRMDLVPPGVSLTDFKTSLDCSPKGAGKRDEFSNELYERDYDMQGAYYLDLWNDVAPREQRKEAFVFVAMDWVDDLELVGIRVMQADEAAIKSGREKYIEALMKWIECSTAGRWPGYDENVAMLSVPEYVRKKYASI